MTPITPQSIPALAACPVEPAEVSTQSSVLYQETLERARMHTEMDLARRVQLRLLPHQPPQVEGLDIYAESCPAWQVGGDFYDFIYQAGRPFIFSVGDITGKGMSAALLMSMTRTVVRSAAKFSSVCMPKTIMSRANVDLYDDFTEVGMFATVFIGQLHPSGEELIYANAGHSPVIYCPVNGRARLLEADGTAMGVLPISTWHNQSVPFRPGDLLIAATDGFSEARNGRGELFGYDRLLAFAEAATQLPARAVAHALYESVRNFAGTEPQDDDQTLVVIRRGG